MGAARPGRIAEIEGLRGVAATSVLALHAGTYSGTFTPGTTRFEVWHQMDSAVAVFFAISGFVLFLPWASAHARGETGPRIGRYALRRAVRILPAYWLALLGTALAFAVGPLSPTQLVSWLGLFTQWLPLAERGNPLGQAWSLNVELLCYLALPVAAYAATALRQRVGSWFVRDLLTCAVLAGVAIAWKVVLGLGGGSIVVLDSPAIAWPVAYLEGFAIGMALAVLVVWREQGGEWPAAVRVALSPLVCWTLWVGACLVAVLVITPPEPMALMGAATPRAYLAEHAVFVACGVLLAAPILAGTAPAWAVRLLSGRWMVVLGTLSYGVFLWHGAVLKLLERAGLEAAAGYPVWVTLAFVASVAIAALSWRLVEQPLLRATAKPRNREAGPAAAASRAPA